MGLVMGKTFAEKIFSLKTGKDLYAGTIVTVKPDFVLTHDNTSAILSTFKKMGGKKVADRNQLVIILDHCIPAADEKHATNHQKAREFVKQQELPHFYDGGRGICHQVMVEEGFALPGSFTVGSDSHTTTYGALGAFSTGIGRSEAAGIWATGEIWLKVPESMKIIMKGKPQKYVTSKDVLLYIAGKILADGALYYSIEFSGDYVDSLGVSERLVFTNMSVEIGAKNGYIAPDAKTFDYLAKRGYTKDKFNAIYPDADAVYAETLEINVAEIEPLVAEPHSVDLIKKAKDSGSVKVHQVLIGTCTNGRIEDFRQAAEVLKGRKIHRDTRLLILPASSEAYIEAMEEGLLKIFIDAGGIVLNPGCGPCLGAHEGIMAPNEVTVSTANRNFKGRMGCNQSFIYLSSPFVAAATAVKGSIATPDML